jgi:outer membrane protein OmpA-like peptidoglycan-associated protein
MTATADHASTSAFLLASLAAAALVAGCATPAPSPAAVEARQSFNQMSKDPKVNQHASVQLYEAQAANGRMEEAIHDGKDEEYVDHLAYLVKRRTDIAQSAAETGALKQQMKELGEKRDQLRLDIRNREIAQLRGQLASRETPRGLVITLGDVLFTTGSATLAAGAERTVSRVAELLERFPDRSVAIEGHTDDVGSTASNEKLSERRAQAVASALTAAGVPETRITVRGLGETSPAVPNKNAASRQQNRRVEIVVIKPPGSTPGS